MSTALQNAARLKPEIRLAQAISEFRSSLSTEQKAKFRLYKDQSQKRQPDISDVMRLTAEIDGREAVGGRCLGPRFTNFLQAVQQFASLGDIVVGGSQNLIACGVWSLVRLSLQMIVVSSSYIEKLSNLLMVAGCSAPRHQEMALLFPRSSALRDHLFEYFIVVVHLCHRIVAFLQRSTLGKIASSLSESELKEFQANLDHWATMIKDDVNSLTAQKVVDEGIENSRFRALFTATDKSVAERRKTKSKLRILERCSTYDFQTPWKQIRKSGNTSLFKSDPDYQAWKSSTVSSTLLCTGKLGAGKSVVMANMVDDLHLHVTRGNALVAYFFCKHDIAESLTARTVIGSLVRQLLVRVSGFPMSAQSLEEPCAAPGKFNVLKLLQQTLLPSTTAYVLVEGLDECNVDERKAALRDLQAVQQHLRLHLCLSVRAGPERMLVPEFNGVTSRKISLSEKNPDIEAFISAELATCIQSGKLTVGDPAILSEIQEALMRGSQGMFLWVALQIKALCSKKTDEAVRQALSNLPKGLSETYSRILDINDEHEKFYQERTLGLVLAARRPLTTQELREALSVTIGDVEWSPAKLINDILSTLAFCGSMLTIDEEASTVHLVHHSAKQFLLSRSHNPPGSTSTEYNIQSAEDSVRLTEDSVQTVMADVIVTYLSYGVFGTELSTTAAPHIHAGSAPSHIIQATAGSRHVSKLASKLLQSKKTAEIDIARTLVGANRRTRRVRSTNEFRFQEYATTHWSYHILHAEQQARPTNKLLPELFSRGLLDVNAKLDNGQSLPLAAAEGRNWMLLTLLFDSGKVILTLMPSELLAMLKSCAATNLREDLFMALLNQVSGIHADYIARILLVAAEQGYEGMVRMLLDCEKWKSARDNSKYRSLISRAAMSGNENVVNRRRPYDTAYWYSAGCDGRTPLSHAAGRGHMGVVKLLLDTKLVHADEQDHRGRTPLSYAAGAGHTGTVKLLLKAKWVFVDEGDHNGRTPLSYAAEKGHTEVVKLLLGTAEADVDRMDRHQRTARDWAELGGHSEVVHLLREPQQHCGHCGSTLRI